VDITFSIIPLAWQLQNYCMKRLKILVLILRYNSKKMEVYYEKNADFIATYVINGMFTKW